jgi:hypothetical protein
MKKVRKCLNSQKLLKVDFKIIFGLFCGQIDPEILKKTDCFSDVCAVYR